ncbi:MAG: hypothetical protein LBK13_07185 [Spirochaetales bacterium]|nr:hypothetical protein [Spirochaetales bacterium]
MNYRLNWDLKDGKLSFDTGRLIVYNNQIIKSNGPSRDHNDLITAFAARYRLNRSDVASNAYRFYWRPNSKNEITVSGVRKIDTDWACDHIQTFDRLIDSLF